MLYSRLLVIMQFSLLTSLFFPWNILGGNLYLSGVLLMLAVILFIWILQHNKRGNFNIVPEPKERAVLVCSGPYRYVRHPMYTGVILVSLAILSYQFAWWKVLVIFLLYGVLLLKARREEGFWHHKTDEYCHYRSQTKMFIPYLF